MRFWRAPSCASRNRSSGRKRQRSRSMFPPSWRRIRPVLPHTDDDSIGSRRRLFGAAFLFVKPKPACAAIGLADPSSFAKTLLRGDANIRHIDGGANSRGKRVRNSVQFARLIVGSVSVAAGGVLFGAAFADDFP